MRRRAFALNQRLKTVLHRRDFDVLRSFLPPKFEYGNDGHECNDERSFPLISLAVKIKCQPLQEELYRTYLLIQDIDPTSRLSNVSFCNEIFSRGVSLDMAKLLGDYQYLMKIWTVSFSSVYMCVRNVRPSSILGC